ncbi:MAG: hypothetical protein ABJ251_01990 [Paracoccaceae bacterium]
MSEISQQLLYQRIRNRVIELLDWYCSFDDLAKFGVSEAINMVDDWLPIDYDKAPNVFNEQEKRVIAEFFQLFEAASNATDEDACDVNWLKSSDEWIRLSAVARNALPVLLERGRFSEEIEEPSLI